MSNYADNVVLHTDPTNLIGYWQLDETSGTNAEDLSSENNDATYNANVTLLGRVVLVTLTAFFAIQTAIDNRVNQAIVNGFLCREIDVPIGIMDDFFDGLPGVMRHDFH